MIAAGTYHNKRVAVLGLGKSGLAAAEALHGAGAEVLLWDDDPKRRQACADAEGAAHNMMLTAPDATAWRDCVALVLSPGIPLTHPAPHKAVTLARTLNLPVIGDIELFAEVLNEHRHSGPLVAITGTNGKSTTTALIGHLLNQAGYRAVVGGNIGAPILSLSAPEPDVHYVLELSSYQIDLTRSLKPAVVVWLNISPDHLDRHGDMDGYVAAKERLLSMAPDSATLILGVDDPHSRTIAEKYNRQGRKVVTISAVQAEGVDVGFDGRFLVVHVDKERLSMVDKPSLRGRHNAQNAAAAVAAARTLGLPLPVIDAGLQSFPGLAHRMQTVAETDGVLFVNDSKATNAAATENALATFDAIYWIVGGRAKAEGIAPLAPYWPRIRRAYLIGEAAENFATTLDGHVDWVMAGTLAQAVRMAREDVKRGAPGGVVLLSPACASFDQFDSFEARGACFAALVQAEEAA